MRFNLFWFVAHPKKKGVDVCDHCANQKEMNDLHGKRNRKMELGRLFE